MEATVETRELRPAPPPEQPPPKRRGRWKTMVQLPLMAVILYYFARTFHASWDTLRAFQWEVKWPFLLAGFVALFVAFAMIPLGNRMNLRILGHDIEYNHSYKAYHYAQLSKYLPGGFWVLLGRFFMYEQAGVKRIVASVSLFVEMSMMIMGSLVLFAFSMIWSGMNAGGAYTWTLWLLPLGLTGLHPKVFSRLVNQVAKMRGIEYRVRFHAKDVLELLAFFVGYAAVIGTGFVFLLWSITPVDLTDFPRLVGIFPGAWVIGFVSFVMPGGLGVREGALDFLLQFHYAQPLPALMAVGARVWWLVIEAICVLVARALK